MPSILDAVRFGPFETAYHAALVTDAFVDAARRFIAGTFLPQVDHDIVEIDGTFTARANEDRYCGPNSAVRNCFLLDLRFFGQAASDVSQIETQLWYQPKTLSFQIACRSSGYLWTPRRRRNREAKMVSIQVVADAILKHESKSASCPICHLDLKIVNTSELIDLACANSCFCFSFEKNQEGRLQRGRFNIPEPRHGD